MAQAVGVVVGTVVAFAILAAITGTVYWATAAGGALCVTVAYRSGLIRR